MMRRLATRGIAAAVWVGVCLAGPAPAAERAWRGAWCGVGKPEKTIACAKDLGFTAVISHTAPKRMAAFASLARRQGLECYYWFSPIARGKDQAGWRQVMSPTDEQAMAAIKADTDPAKHGYQFGGEPLPGRHDVLLNRLLCFHRPEVVAFCKQKIRSMLEACPDLTGVAFDYFGYQNYRCCLCEHSEKLFKAYRAAHPDLPAEEARNRFSLDTLVAFNNDMAAFVRQARPGAKVACHVYPVFAPDPLYGNRLDVDYCCQTVAWFFRPYWSDEKIARYTKMVVAEQNKYHPRQRGIPFIGVYVGRPYADKSPERLAHELGILSRIAPDMPFSVCGFNDFVKHPKLRPPVKRALTGQSGK